MPTKATQTPAADVLFFETPADLRDWLAAHHASARELWVGYYKKGTGRASITWPESVDEALCLGWIDGIRKGIDAQRYKVRFTPRKATSVWSAVNIGRVAELTREGRMQPAGVEAFARRIERRSQIYSYENRDGAEFSAEDEKQFRASPTAWRFFQAQAPGYRRLNTWRVISAKRPETRAKRLAKLIAESGAGRRIA